jgi:hypothetical protein
MIQKDCRRSFFLHGPEDTHKRIGKRSQLSLVAQHLECNSLRRRSKDDSTHAALREATGNSCRAP